MTLALLLSLILACGDKGSDDTGSTDGGDGGFGDGGFDDGGSSDGGGDDGGGGGDGGGDGGAATPTVDLGTVMVAGTTWTQISTNCDATGLLSIDSALRAKGTPDLRLLAQFTDYTAPPSGWYGNANGLIFNLQLTDGSAEWVAPAGVSDTVYLDSPGGGRFDIIWNEATLESDGSGPTYTSSGWLSCTL